MECNDSVEAYIRDLAQNILFYLLMPTLCTIALGFYIWISGNGAITKRQHYEISASELAKLRAKNVSVLIKDVYTQDFGLAPLQISIKTEKKDFGFKKQNK